MHAIELNDPAGFGNEFLRLTLLQGFQSLTKRDLELLIFVLIERDGAINRSDSNAAVALQLRVTPAKVKGLRRDGYARWRALVPEEGDSALQRIVAAVLTEANLRSGAKHVSERSRKEGFLAIRIEHPDDAQRFEQAILDVGAHDGLLTIPLARLPASRVLAFEPLPDKPVHFVSHRGAGYKFLPAGEAGKA